MQKEKKICIRITPRRVVVTVLVAASILNLMIIGAAFQAVYFTATPMLSQIVTTPPLTATVLIPTTAWHTFTPTQISTQTATSTATNTITPTNTFTQTSSVTPTLTFTSTFTLTSSPIPCMRQFSWPVHVVQRGDTLFALAL